MHEAGLVAYQQRKESKTGIYAYENKDIPLSEEFEVTFKNNKKAWSFFTSQAPSYQKTARHWVMRAKQEKTKLKRLNDLIIASENQERAKPFRR